MTAFVNQKSDKNFVYTVLDRNASCIFLQESMRHSRKKNVFFIYKMFVNILYFTFTVYNIFFY